MPRSSSSSSSRSSSNKSRSQRSTDKYEIAEELGVNIGKDATASENGKVGGEMRKRKSQSSSSKKSSR